MSNYLNLGLKTDFDLVFNEDTVESGLVSKIKDFFSIDKTCGEISLPIDIIEGCKEEDDKQLYFAVYTKSVNGLVKRFSFIICEGSKEEKEGKRCYKVEKLIDLDIAESLSDMKQYVKSNYNITFKQYDTTEWLDFMSLLKDMRSESNDPFEVMAKMKLFENMLSNGKNSLLNQMMEEKKNEIISKDSNKARKLSLIDEVAKIKEMIPASQTRNRIKAILGVFSKNTSYKYSGMFEEFVESSFSSIYEKLQATIDDKNDLGYLLMAVMTVLS